MNKEEYENKIYILRKLSLVKNKDKEIDNNGYIEVKPSKVVYMECNKDIRDPYIVKHLDSMLNSMFETKRRIF